jgi:hypothetical protein
MDWCSAREWLDEIEGETMAQKLRIPDGMKPARKEQVRRGLMGILAQRNEKAPPPTLPPVKGPTLAEIEAKYGELRK